MRALGFGHFVETARWAVSRTIFHRAGDAPAGRLYNRRRFAAGWLRPRTVLSGFLPQCKRNLDCGVNIYRATVQQAGTELPFVDDTANRFLIQTVAERPNHPSLIH